MSANNLIYINRGTFKVYYQSCADNEGFGEEIGKGNNLEEAVDIAQKEIGDCGGNFEYGIWFVGKARPKRDKEMIDSLNTGEFTLQDMGEKYQITRERVRQIYFRYTGKPFQKYIENRKKVIFIKRQAFWDSEKFKCKGCGKSVLHKDAFHRFCYCLKCKKLRKDEQRNPCETINCETCKKPFHPFIDKKPKGRFCSRECYFNSEGYVKSRIKKKKCLLCAKEIIGYTSQKYCRECSKIKRKERYRRYYYAKKS